MIVFVALEIIAMNLSWLWFIFPVGQANDTQDMFSGIDNRLFFESILTFEYFLLLCTLKAKRFFDSAFVK